MSDDASRMRLRKALADLLKRYVDLVNSGDAGYWDPMNEAEVIQAVAALDADSKAEGLTESYKNIKERTYERNRT